LNRTNIQNITEVAVRSRKNEDCTEINDRILTAYIQDDSRPYCSVDSVDTKMSQVNIFVLLSSE